MPSKRVNKSHRSYFTKHIYSNPYIFYPLLIITLAMTVSWLLPDINLSNASLYIEEIKWMLYNQKKYPPSLVSSFMKSSHHIQHYKWENKRQSDEIISEIVSQRQPVLIKQGPASSWPLIDWDIIAFLKSGQDMVLEGVRWQREPVFVLGREREKGGMLGSPKDTPLLYVNTTMMEFLRSIFDPSQYLYMTGELSWLEAAIGTLGTKPAPATASPRQDWHAFRYIEPSLRDELEDSDEGEIWRPMVWLSHPGVVAQTHYDPQHNFLSQLQGSKRVLLFPPSEPNMYLYPHIHRSHRQSQLHLEKRENKSAVNSEIFEVVPKAMEVVLNRGDTLYIPPYWHHRVESLTMSLSISVTSPAALEAAFAEVYWLSVPFGKFAESSEGRKVAAKLYLGLLLHRLDLESNLTLKRFSQELYRDRFRPLYPEEWMDRRRGGMECPGFPGEGSKLAEHIKDTASSLEEVVVSAVTKLNAIDVPVQLKKMFLGDYVEEISRWAVGPPQTVFYIHDCLGA